MEIITAASIATYAISSKILPCISSAIAANAVNFSIVEMLPIKPAILTKIAESSLVVDIADKLPNLDSLSLLKDLAQELTGLTIEETDKKNINKHNLHSITNQNKTTERQH